MGETLPPLRIRENDGNPNVIPVYHIVLSSNLTLENKGGGIVSISASTGAGGTAQAPITFPLIVGSGGTGTINQYGSGGIIFAWTGGGIYAADTANLFWHAIPKVLVVGGNTTTTGFAEQKISVQGDIVIPRAADFQAVSFARAEGTLASPTVVASPQVVGAVNFFGFDGTQYTEMVRLEGIVNGVVAADSLPGALIINITPLSDNTVREVARWTRDGNLGLGNTAPTVKLYVAGSSRFDDILSMASNKIVSLALCTAGSDAANKHYVDSVTGGGTSIVYAATGNNYVVMNLAADLTAEHRLVQSGNSITITTAAGLITINAVTSPTLTTQIIDIPMALLSVEVNSGNAFWTAQTDTTRMDKAYINHVDSGRSVSTWWCYAPRHLNATPAWGLDIVSEAAVGGSAGGFIVLNVDGMSVATGESANTLAASTIQLVSATSFQLNTAGILSLSTMTATNFDGTLATSATDYVKVKLTRVGQSDTLNSDWYVYSVKFKCTVDT